MDKSYQAVGLMIEVIGKAMNGATSYEDLSKDITEGVMEALEWLGDEPAQRVSSSRSFSGRLVRNIINDRRNTAEQVSSMQEQLSDPSPSRVSGSGSFKKRLIRNILSDERDGVQARRPSRRTVSQNMVKNVTSALEQLRDTPSSHISNGGSFKRRLVGNILNDGRHDARTGFISSRDKELSHLENMVELARRLSDDSDDDDDDDNDDDGTSRFPNLKYAKPKYNNVDSIVKNIGGGDGGDDGVKVTIMNFND